MHPIPELEILNLRVTHRSAPLPLLERFSFKDILEETKRIHELDGVHECFILQTCNRVEIFAIVSKNDLEEISSRIARYWKLRANLGVEFRLVEYASGLDALEHLLRLATGIESMMIGESQILGQIRAAMDSASRAGSLGMNLRRIVNKILEISIQIRNQVGINRGGISMGSAALELAENILGSLEDKQVLIIGAGEMGEIIAKALAARRRGIAIFAANRTYERALRLAEMVGGRALRLEEIDHPLRNVDLVIVATSAPHYILRRDHLERILPHRNRPLLIIDLGQPRNVEETIAQLPGVELRNIEHLREIAERNLNSKLAQAEKAEKMISEKLPILESLLKQIRVEPMISQFCSQVERIRRMELKEALAKLGGSDQKLSMVLESLTRSLIKKILHSPITNLRRAAQAGEEDVIQAFQYLFGFGV